MTGMRIGLIGPLPPPPGGMANQTRQLARLLTEEGMHVELLQTNAPYRPPWIEHVWGLRALFRLLPYLWRLWKTARQVELFHHLGMKLFAFRSFGAFVPAFGLGEGGADTEYRHQ